MLEKALLLYWKNKKTEDGEEYKSLGTIKFGLKCVSPANFSCILRTNPGLLWRTSTKWNFGNKLNTNFATTQRVFLKIYVAFPREFVFLGSSNSEYEYESANDSESEFEGEKLSEDQKENARMVLDGMERYVYSVENVPFLKFRTGQPPKQTATMNLSRVFPIHLNTFREGQKALPFLSKITNNEIVRVLRVYAKHVRKIVATRYSRSSEITRIVLGLEVIVVNFLRKSTEFWEERVRPILFFEGLNFFDCLSNVWNWVYL